MEAAEKVLVDYLRQNCPRHVAYFAADESKIREHCVECANAYGVLGLWQQEDSHHIKTAYRELAKKWHPDRFSGNDEGLRQEAEDHFKAVCMAYRHLRAHA